METEAESGSASENRLGGIFQVQSRIWVLGNFLGSWELRATTVREKA